MNAPKRIVINIPADLYKRFSDCKLRRECNTDAEGIRAAIRNAIKPDQECQANYK